MNKKVAFLSGLAIFNMVFAANSYSAQEKPSLPMPMFNDISILDGAALAKGAMPERQNFYYIKPKRSISVVITGYSSSEDETDSTPFITATGTFTRPGVAASNFLPLGTKFRIPEMYGETVFTIEDRMNPVYNGKNWVDIWFESKTKAKIFGKKTAEIEIL